MKFEVRCGDCDKAWMIDESPSGGEMVCPECLARIELPSGPTAAVTPPVQTVVHIPSPRPATKPAPAPRAPSAPAESARPAAPPESAPAPAPQPAVLAPSIPDEVVCPRCKLHFSPHNRPVEKAGERETILVIEDQLYFRQIAEDALGSTYEVKTASDPTEARQHIAEGGLDLIVLDLTLDGGDQGRSLLNELVPKPCPILIFTAQDESEMYGNRWDELADLGADDLLIKGMNVGDSLVRKVAALLGHPVEEE